MTNSFLDRISKLPANKLALLAAELQSRLEAEQNASRQPIAIVGVGCRLPGGGDTPETFGAALAQGRDAIEQIDPVRWDGDSLYDPDPDAAGKVASKWGGFLKDIDLFDPAFFGIAPREAQRLDPQHRMLLETSWEALERAGIAPLSLAGSHTGVFVGLSNNDYGAMLLSMADESIDGYTASGAAHSVAAGRLSYFYGWKGPSLAIDTACSSSGVAIHLACQSLRQRECNLALAGGVNLLLLPQTTMALSRSHMLAPDGRCKTFAAEADGFVRSEGCGLLVLKRLSEALADGDPVVGVIRGTACNQDGRSSGLTAPNGPSQEEVIRAALKNAGLRAADVDYVEAHGTGTALGDPIEIGALANVFAKDRAGETPLVIGSVKANIGHLESAAAVAGVMKVLTSFEREELPPHLHAARRNPRIAWDRLPFVIPGTKRSWSRGERRRVAGVSSFGFSGTNVHLVLEEPPAQPVVPGEADEQREPEHLLTLSAKTEPALRALCGRYEEVLRKQPAVNIADLCFSAGVGRSPFAHRFAMVGSSAEELRAGLQAYAGEGGGVFESGVVAPDQSRFEAAFYFSGSVALREAQVSQLYEQMPAFRVAFDQCGEAAKLLLGVPLTSGFEPGAGRAVEYVACFSFAVEYALAQLWRAWGGEPGVLIAEGAGAYPAACLAGVFSIDDGLQLAIAALRRTPTQAGIACSEPAIALTIVNVAGARWADAHWWNQQEFQPDTGSSTLDSRTLEGCRTILQLGSAASRCACPEGVLWMEALPAAGDARLAMLQTAARLYVRGFQPAWKDVYSGEIRRKLLLPTYPFQRTRYWIETTAQPNPRIAAAAVPLEWLYEVKWERTEGTVSAFTPAELAARADRRLAKKSEAELKLYEHFQDEINGLSVDYAWAALSELGFAMRPGSLLALSAEAAGVVPRHGRLWTRLLALLEMRGMLQRRGSLWECAAQLSLPPAVRAERLLRQYPQFVAEIEFLKQAKHLSAVLQGKMDPLQALFPDGSMAASERLYQEAPAAKYFNEAVAAAVRELVSTLPQNRPIRVLEIGAGTGSATVAVLRELEGFPCEYRFTDVSHAFLANARQKFARYPFLSFGLLDIEEPAGWKGVARHGFDVIVAANILHATGNLRTSLRNVQQLLTEGGNLVLLEGTSPQPFGDLTVGMTAGWWRFQDLDLRPDYPLISRARWLQLFAEEGFSAAALGEEHKDNVLWSGQSVFLARSHKRQVPGAGLTTQKHFVLLSGGADAESLKSRLNALGHDAEMVADGGERGWETALRDIKAKARRPVSLVYLEALDQDGRAETPGAGPAAEAVCFSTSVLKIVQAAANIRASSEIWIVTKGAQAVAGEPVAVAGAALWGLARTAALELPELNCRCVDMEATALDAFRSMTALSELLAGEGSREAGFAVRSEQVFVPRLTPASFLPSASPPKPACEADATYLITGAYGGLGPAVAGWLVEQGARELFLVGRSAPSAAVRTTLSKLAQQGIRIHQLQADVGSRDAMVEVFSAVAASGGRLKGILHLAGTLQDRTILQQDEAGFSQVVQPKVEGAWLLHELSLGYRLDFFVIFASAASVMGSAGQANHAAANACLDALAHFRRSQGWPAVSIDWGPWSEIGAAAGRDTSRGDARGVGLISPRQGLDLLTRIMQQDISQVAVLPIEWSKYLSAMPAGVPPFLEKVAGGVRQRPAAAADPKQEVPAGVDLSARRPEERPQAIRDYVAGLVAQALRLDSAQAVGPFDSLPELGLDSLMALELKNQLQEWLGRSLPADLIFQYPTVEAIATYLEAVMMGTSVPLASEMLDQEEISI